MNYYNVYVDESSAIKPWSAEPFHVAGMNVQQALYGVFGGKGRVEGYFKIEGDRYWYYMTDTYTGKPDLRAFGTVVHRETAT